MKTIIDTTFDRRVSIEFDIYHRRVSFNFERKYHGGWTPVNGFLMEGKSLDDFADAIERVRKLMVLA